MKLLPAYSLWRSMHICEKNCKVLFIHNFNFMFSSSQCWLGVVIPSKLIKEALDDNWNYVQYKPPSLYEKLSLNWLPMFVNFNFELLMLPFCDLSLDILLPIFLSHPLAFVISSHDFLFLYLLIVSITLVTFPFLLRCLELTCHDLYLSSWGVYWPLDLPSTVVAWVSMLGIYWRKHCDGVTALLAWWPF